jgi:integrase
MKLTKRTIDALPPGPEKGRWYADDELAGFYAIRYPSSTYFAVRFRVHGRRRALRVGLYGEVTPDTARKEARGILARARIGEDPAAAKQKARTIPTWAAWTTLYAARVQGVKKSAAQDERYLGLAEEGGEVFRKIRRAWGPRALTEITPEDVLEARDLLRKTPVQANRWAASVRACFGAAIAAGHLTANPAREVPQFLEGPPRQRVLSADETDSLLRAIDAEEDPHARAGLLLLLTTGARLTEALRAKWEDLSDLEGPRPMWTIPSPKAGTPQAVPLPAAVVKVLRRLARIGPYIVTGRKELAPRKDLKGAWSRALERAGLSSAGIHVHDLRRSHGLEVYRTSGLLAAQKLLRHSDPRVTAAVYVPLAAEDLRGAQEKRSRLLKFRMTRKAG